MPNYKGRSCIIPNCKSGYVSSKHKKIAFFSVSEGEENVKKCQIAVQRENFIVKSCQVACEKHFLPEDIDVKDPQGNVMATVSIFYSIKVYQYNKMFTRIEYTL